MTFKKSLIAYFPMILVFSLWSLFISWIDYISDGWGLSFYIIVPLAIVYPLIELSLRPINVSFRYTRVLKVIGLILSVLIGFLIFIQIGLTNCCGGGQISPLSSFLPLVLAAPFAYYSIIQEILWRKYTKISDRKLLILKSRIAAVALILILVVGTLRMASY